MKKVLFYGMTEKKMCFQHILMNALDLYNKAKEEGLIAGVCLACSKVLEVYDKNLESGLTMLDDMNGHAGMKKYIEEGYEVISM